MNEPTDPEESNHKLSLLTQFDDLCRFSDNLIRSSDDQKPVLGLIKTIEYIRLGWLSTKGDLKESEKQIRDLNLTLSRMKSNIKELNEKKVNLRNQTIRLRNQFNSLRKLILSKGFCGCDRIQRQLLKDFDTDIEIINEELESDCDEWSSFKESEANGSTADNSN